MSEKNHRCACDQLKELLYGPPGKPKESIVWVMEKHDEILNGTKDDPHGLIEDVRNLKDEIKKANEKLNRFIWTGIGVGFAIGVIWKLFTHFDK